MKCRAKVGKVWSNKRFPRMIVHIPLIPGLFEQHFCDPLLSQFDPCIYCYFLNRTYPERVRHRRSLSWNCHLPKLITQALLTKELVQACTCSSSVHPHHLCGWGVWSYRCIRVVVSGNKGGWLTVNHLHSWTAYVDFGRQHLTPQHHHDSELMIMSGAPEPVWQVRRSHRKSK